MNNIYKQTESILAMYPATRNSDKELTIKVWQTYYSEQLTGGYVKLENILTLPALDSISRFRRMIQAQGKHLPTSEKVVKARRMSVDWWKEVLGYKLPNPNQTSII
jgi:hypothetical protein